MDTKYIWARTIHEGLCITSNTDGDDGPDAETIHWAQEELEKLQDMKMDNEFLNPRRRAKEVKDLGVIVIEKLCALLTPADSSLF